VPKMLDDSNRPVAVEITILEFERPHIPLANIESWIVQFRLLDRLDRKIDSGCLETGILHCLHLVGASATTFQNLGPSRKILAGYDDNVILPADSGRLSLGAPACVPKLRRCLRV